MRVVLALLCGIVVTSCSQRAPLLPVDARAPVQSHEASFSGPPTTGYQTLYAFAGQPSDGAQPQAGLTSFGGRLYGTTAAGGSDGVGTLYSIGQSGDERLLFSFPSHGNGKRPESALTPLHGTLYGVTAGGGGTDCDGGCGSLFKVEPSGSAQPIYGFTGGGDGMNPVGDLIALKGKLYGTTVAGGCSNSYCFPGCNCGTVFAMTPSGRQRQLHSFDGPSGDGDFPVAGVIYADGGLYGVTRTSAFKLSIRGAFRRLHQFNGGRDGFDARGALLMIHGALYGTTAAGGTGCGNKGCGTIFRLTPSGLENVLYRFKGGSDGRTPTAGLVAVNGMLYGTTQAGGGCRSSASGCGTIFKISPSGEEQILYRFKGGKDGKFPGHGKLLHLDGALYGTTEKGGAKNAGTIFKLAL